MTLRFDPHANFIASRPLMVSGKQLHRGDVFDNDLVSIRKLQMLWECRHICYDWQFEDKKIKPELKNQSEEKTKNETTHTTTLKLKKKLNHDVEL